MKFFNFLILFAFIFCCTNLSGQTNPTETDLLIAELNEKIEQHETKYKDYDKAGIIMFAIPLYPILFPFGAHFISKAENEKLYIYQLEKQKEIALSTSPEEKEKFMMEIHEKYLEVSKRKLKTSYIVGGAGLGIAALSFLAYASDDPWIGLGVIALTGTGLFIVASAIPFLAHGEKLKEQAKLILKTGILPEISSFSNGLPMKNSQYIALGLSIPLGW